MNTFECSHVTISLFKVSASFVNIGNQFVENIINNLININFFIFAYDWSCCWWYLGYPDIRESCYRCIREGGLLCFPINPQHNSIDRHLYYAASHYQGHQTASRFFGYDFEAFCKVSSIEYRDIEYGYRTVLIQVGTVASPPKSLGPEILLGFSSLASIFWITSVKNV